MGAAGKPVKNRIDPGQQEVREQEVLRANKELAAYFKGQRTEREARAALKIIKAFIRDRERLDPASRRPFPAASGSVTAKGRPQKPARAKPRVRRSKSASRTTLRRVDSPADNSQETPLAPDPISTDD
jgi:hypothetical protein